jgi:LysM repeat protein
VDPIVLAVVGLVVAVALAALVFGWARRGATRRPDEIAILERPSVTSGPSIIQPSRIVVVGDRRPGGSTAAGRVDRPAPAADPRRRLLRDAAAVLVVGSLGVVALVNLPVVGGSSGGVLSATATPAAGFAQPEPTPAPAPSAFSPTLIAPASAEVGGSGSSSDDDSLAAPVPSTPAATPSSASIALLQPCPGRTDCYVYVVQRGDTLTWISSRFGIATDTILRLNPTITDPSLIVTGDRLALPPPTR